MGQDRGRGMSRVGGMAMTLHPGHEPSPTHTHKQHTNIPFIQHLDSQSYLYKYLNNNVSLCLANLILKPQQKLQLYKKKKETPVVKSIWQREKESTENDDVTIESDYRTSLFIVCGFVCFSSNFLSAGSGSRASFTAYSPTVCMCVDSED